MNFSHFLSIEYLVVVIGAAVLYLLYFVFIKDTAYSKNLRTLANIIEEQNREIFYLKKRQEENSKAIKDTPKALDEEQMYMEMERVSFEMAKPLSIAIKNLQQNLNELDHNLNARVLVLENNLKQISIPASIHAKDDEKIITLFKKGVDIENIAKELHISKAEVDFVLKINKIK